MLKLLEALGYTPRTSVWEITLKCNLNCLHCGSRAGHARGDELTTEEALDVADQLADLGLNLVTLSGGEPLVRQDWPEIAARLTEKGTSVNLISNATLVDKEVVAKGKAAGLKNFLFSMDGIGPAHDRIRNRDGAWDALQRAVRICREQGMAFAPVTHINQLNRNDLERMYELCREWGAFAWQIQPGIPMGNFLDNAELMLEPKDLLDVYPRVAALFDRAAADGDVELYAADGIGYYGGMEQSVRGNSPVGSWYGCSAGCQVIGVEANGNIKPCLSMQSDEFVVGNVREKSLREIWEDDESFAFNRKFEPSMLEGFCATCRYGDICRAGCRFQAFSSSGSMFDNPYCYYRQLVEAGLEGEGEKPPIPTL